MSGSKKPARKFHIRPAGGWLIPYCRAHGGIVVSLQGLSETPEERICQKCLRRYMAEEKRT